MYGTSLTWGAVKGTKVVWLALVIVTLAQFAITYLPFLQKVFTTKAIPIVDGMLIVAVGVAFFAIIEIEKQLRLRMSSIRTIRPAKANTGNAP